MLARICVALRSNCNAGPQLDHTAVLGGAPNPTFVLCSAMWLLIDHKEFLPDLGGNVHLHQPVEVTFHEQLLRVEVVA